MRHHFRTQKRYELTIPRTPRQYYVYSDSVLTMRHSIACTHLVQPLHRTIPGIEHLSSDWQVPMDKEHHFINNIREAILRYRLQSASHFDLPIQISQRSHEKNPSIVAPITPSFKIVVGFYNFGHEEPFLRICRPSSKRPSRKSKRVLTHDIEVFDDESFISLSTFLGIHFPTLNVPVGEGTMYRWWRENGKTFNWTGLPTELKERIILSCMHNTPVHRICSRRKKHSGRKQHTPFEITNQLGDWLSLLHVSHQVRALTLRLCFVGSGDLAYGKGLCINATTHFELKNCIRRLSKHYQMLLPNSVPVDEATHALAKTYKNYPKLYPHLNQYATMRHGIRKIHMHMDFLPSMHFFKVTAGGFHHFWQDYHTNYHVLEQLPHLNELIIRLSNPQIRMENQISDADPPIWYEDFECPRFLHRLIYEKAAEVLARYENVTVYGFIDDVEMLRFGALRKAAVKALQFTSAELEELYAEDGGGIQLEESEVPGSYGEKDKEISPLKYVEDGLEDVQPLDEEEVPSSFWPPKCRCDVLCRKLVFQQ
jgi:hypothetical protein